MLGGGTGFTGSLEICDCMCHGDLFGHVVLHCVPCCYRCDQCGKNIKAGLSGLHQEGCAANRDGMTEQVPIKHRLIPLCEGSIRRSENTCYGSTGINLTSEKKVMRLGITGQRYLSQRVRGART